MADRNKAQEGSPVRSGYFNRDVFQKRSRMLLILKTGISGFTHSVNLNTPEGRALMESLMPGTELLLLRDTENIHDKWAISVYTMDKQKLGYITRFKNETVARLMDYGKVLHAYVDEKQKPPDDPVQRRRTFAPTEGFEVPFSVYLED